MKVFVYSCKDDEKILLEEYKNKFNLEIGFCKEQPGTDNVELAAGYDCISMVGTILPNDVLVKFKELGIKFISTRSIGYDHIDIKKARELGIKVANIVYSPNAVADFAIMLMLMSLRKAKYIMNRYAVNDYTLAWNQGRELRNMTIGIIGTGRIGRTVMKEISGFGCRIIAYDKYENEETKQYAEYVDFDTLIGNSDLISLHAPATESTYHMINCENVNKMKKGIVIINTSRGSLVDNKALIKGLEEKVISAAGMDVIDNEPFYYNIDHKDSLLVDHDIAILESFPNVIITPHTAFYTDQAVRDMVENSLKSCVSFMKHEKILGEIV